MTQIIIAEIKTFLCRPQFSVPPSSTTRAKNVKCFSQFFPKIYFLHFDCFAIFVQFEFSLFIHCSDHEYEPIGEPLQITSSPPQPIAPTLPQPTIEISVPEPSPQQQLPAEPEPQVHVTTIEDEDYELDTESPVRSITPFTDISRTEEIHTSQIDDSILEELPLRREDRKKKSFMTNAGETTKNFQSKLSAGASSLRTKFRRPPKSPSAGGSTLKTTLKSSPKTTQASPKAKERKKMRRYDFTSKLKSIHMPKMSRPDIKRPELPKFRIPDKLRFHRNASAKKESVDSGEFVEGEDFAVPAANESVTITTITTTTTTTADDGSDKPVLPRKRFDFSSSKLFNRFRGPSKEEPIATDSEFDAITESVTTEPDKEKPHTSSFSTHFATVPRAANKIKDSIMSKLSRKHSRDHHATIDSDSLPAHDTVDLSREDSVERRIRLAAKVSMDDDEQEEALGILHPKDQIDMADYDEENREIHKISMARQDEFKSRKPLVHQDSDLLSEESNRDIDWEECERMRNKILGQPKPSPMLGAVTTLDASERRRRTDSNFSTEETQSSGSSCDRRRTGIIEDIDDDEFFLRQRGISQDNEQISEYISSAIRGGMATSSGHNEFGYSDENFGDDANNDETRYRHRPIKPFRRLNRFNKSFESSEFDHGDDYARRNYDDDVFRYDADEDVPDRGTGRQYFSRNDNENILFHDSEFNDDRSHFDYESDPENLPFDHKATPVVPKRRRKGRASVDRKDSFDNKENDLENEVSALCGSGGNE